MSLLTTEKIPSRVARLRALGNAVVPAVVEQIGRAILAAEQNASGTAIKRGPNDADKHCEQTPR